MIAHLLVDTGDYQVTVGDSDQGALDKIAQRVQVNPLLLDASDRGQLTAALAECDSVISALSFRFNPLIAKFAQEAGVSYFDLTEDVETTRQVQQIAQQTKPGQIFMPQCGLAPGFISIVANHVAQSFDQLHTVWMRVGALPQFPTGTLKYNLTWSTDGLINEYCNPCEAIHGGQLMEVLPLEGLEHFSLDGVRYEAFNTSGGLGTLCQSFAGRVQELNYKTVRYQGHRDAMQLLVNELQLKSRREILKDIMEHAVPLTFQDVVITFCTATGMRRGQLVQITDARKVYHESIAGENWSAIQLTTAAGICAVVDMHVAGELPATGFVHQEQVDFGKFIANRFGKRYDSTTASNFTRLDT